MNDLFLIINAAGAIECASPAAALAFGYDAAELSGQPLRRVLQIPDQGDTAKPVSMWFRPSQSPILEGIHRGGRRFPVRLIQHEFHGAAQAYQVLCLRDPDAVVHAARMFSRDRELYEVATQQGRVAVWEADYRTNHLEFSPVLAKLLGMKDTEIPTSVEGWKAYFHPDDWQSIEKQTEQVLRHEIPEISTECRVFHVDGRTLWVLVRGKTFFDENDKPIKTIGTSIDITERKKAEEERDLFFTLSLDLLCIADTKGYFRRVNPAFCKTLGYSLDELTSRPFFSFVHPEDTAATERALAQLSEGADIIAFVNRYRCKDGSWRWLSWTCPAVLPNSDTVYAIARDVTEARRVEAALQKAMHEADQANRAKSEFLSRTSHELRTPLNAILGFGQLLLREPLAPRLRQQTEMIVKGGRHLVNLIDEVLDISRIEMGRLDLSPESVELAELIQEIVGLTQPMADQRGIRLILDQASIQDRRVLADKQRLKQVLLNLVSNAIKYNVDQGRVRVFGEAGATAAARFRIHVQDTGPGIAEDKRHRLFMPFERLGAETTAVEGSGLGLVLSKRLVEIMGGTLTLDSQVGRGTTLTVELAVQNGARPRRDALPAQGPAPVSTQGPSRRVLYIEDNLANVQLIEALIAFRPGVRLVSAMQGGLGLELARQQRPDLILLDVHLPDMRGHDLMALLRADPDLRNIPVIVISADATEHQIDRLRSAGVKEYLTKPIDVDQFLRVLDRYLE